MGKEGQYRSPQSNEIRLSFLGYSNLLAFSLCTWHPWGSQTPLGGGAVCQACGDPEIGCGPGGFLGGAPSHVSATPHVNAILGANPHLMLLK